MSEELRAENEPAAATAKDRRRSGRVGCRWLKSNFGAVMDISTSGVRIHTAGKPEVSVGETVILRLNTNVGSLLVCSRVVRCQKVEGGGHDVGFEFCEKDKELRAALTQAARMHGKGETVGAEAADRLCSA